MRMRMKMMMKMRVWRRSTDKAAAFLKYVHVLRMLARRYMRTISAVPWFPAERDVEGAAGASGDLFFFEASIDEGICLYQTSFGAAFNNPLLRHVYSVLRIITYHEGLQFSASA